MSASLDLTAAGIIAAIGPAAPRPSALDRAEQAMAEARPAEQAIERETAAMLAEQWRIPRAIYPNRLHGLGLPLAEMKAEADRRLECLRDQARRGELPDINRAILLQAAKRALRLLMQVES